MSPIVKISAGVVLLIVIGVAAWLMLSAPDTDEPSQFAAREEGVAGEQSEGDSENSSAAQDTVQTEDAAVEAARETVTPEVMRGSFMARCDQELTNFAVKNKMNPRTYLENNQDAYRRCVDGYMSNPAKAFERQTTQEPQTQPAQQ